MLLAQRGAGGYTLFFGETWPYYAIATPCVPIFAFLGYYLALKKSVTNK